MPNYKMRRAVLEDGSFTARLLKIEKFQGKEDLKIVFKAIDSALDALAQDDFFGTERQNDPRGDGRD